MPTVIHPGDIVRLRKKHPCGSYEWEVVRTGTDVGLRCLGCHHKIMLTRSAFEKAVKQVVRRANATDGQDTTAL